MTEALEVPLVATSWDALIARLRYKPGWEFGVTDGGRVFVIIVTTQDSTRLPPERGPASLVRIRHTYALPQFLAEKWTWKFLRSCIHRSELHESDEWIRIDGQVKFDPHRFA